MTTGITNISNMAPELPLQMAEDWLSTPMFNLIHSFGADLHYASPHAGKTTRMSRMERLSTDGGQLDGSGIDPAPEVPVRSDIDATMEIYAKSIVVNEQVSLWEHPNIQAKYSMLAGQWMREKEDLLMRDLLASSPTYIPATGGGNNDQPTEITAQDVNNIERILLSNDARTLVQSVQATQQFSTNAVRDAFFALCNSDIVSDLQAVSNVTLKADYAGNQDSFKPEEYCSISRFRFFTSSKGAKSTNASTLGATIYKIPMFGVEAFGKVEQNNYSAKLGYIPDWVMSRVAQNCGIYAKFAIARAIENQSWLSGLLVTQRL